ncbi:MAG: hypothetical protein V4610_09585 [Pseudomonadota bacterium]|jgi:hypothetical protein
MAKSASTIRAVGRFSAAKRVGAVSQSGGCGRAKIYARAAVYWEGQGRFDRDAAADFPLLSTLGGGVFFLPLLCWILVSFFRSQINALSGVTAVMWNSGKTAEKPALFS